MTVYIRWDLPYNGEKGEKEGGSEMASAPVLYLCADGFCVLLLLFLFLKAKDSLFVGNHELFVRVLLTNCVLLLTDTLFALFDHRGVGAFAALDRVNCAANFILSGVAGLTWFHYAEAELGIRISDKPRVVRMLTATPALLLTVLTLLSLKNGWLFSIGDEGFQRGPLYVMQPILAWGYTVVPSAHAILRGHRTHSYAERVRCRALGWFLVPSLAAAVLRMFIEGVPVLCMAITFSLLAIYINSQDQMISSDPLTGLHNRYSLQVYLSEKLEGRRGDMGLYLLLVDADDFKSINDRFGHAEGDRAICTIAEALKACVEQRNGFAARYGGDEFCVIVELPGSAAAEVFCAEIEAALAVRCQGWPYQLRVSIGCAAAAADASSEVLFALADAEMYRRKKSRK